MEGDDTLTDLKWSRCRGDPGNLYQIWFHSGKFYHTIKGEKSRDNA